MTSAFLNPRWPVLTSYDQEHLGRIALPLGGIGTGTVSLGGRGQLLDWELQNLPAKNIASAENFGLKTYGAASLFVLYAKPEGEPAVARALEGELTPPYEGSHGCTEGFHGVPRFRQCSFHAAYPLAQVVLQDEDVPVSVRLEAFNPLIPADSDASGLPVAVLRYVLRNTSDKTVQATVCGSLANICAGETRRNRRREVDGLRGLVFDAVGGDDLARGWGDLALATTAENVTFKSVWPEENWRRPLLHFWDDLVADGALDEIPNAHGGACPMGSLAASVALSPGEESSVTFVLSWRFPNRYNWAPRSVECDCGDKRLEAADLIGNYYSEQFSDAWSAAADTMARMSVLEAKTVSFVSAFCESSLPEAVKEAALFNVSTLRSETCFRTPDGRFYGWEGCCDGTGCCSGSCTHVWNYESTVPHLFGDLARSMREVEFLHATNPETGGMSFRVALPIEREEGKGKCAADGQMGCIVKAYREWRLCGDDEWLRNIWPRVRKALEFCWIPGGWDADRDGVMEGCQHNTMDVEYYGPNPQMGTWYLAALRAATEMAEAVGEPDFSRLCADLFQKGSVWLDAHLFNGEYYEHEIRPPASEDDVADTLRLQMGATDVCNPELQLGSGCLVDQLVGQCLAHTCGLGYLLDPDHVRKTLSSIMRYNFRESFHDHFNNMRTFVLNDESALLMASYPRGGRPKSPFPYFTEVMTGFEYCAATHMLYEGMEEEGLKCIEAIRDRYDGARRSPFNEAECGHHYARAMAAWAGVLALTGFQYDGTTGHMCFAAKEGRFFWANGVAWGTCELRKTDDCWQARLSVLHGTLALRAFSVGEVCHELPEVRVLTEGVTAELGLSG
ncbi:MAG: hypothetical protein KAI66_12385 [Lentisphaeria bacterium]|nr:hypothetical protein [Lentisphaeria bacterium]